MPSNRSERDSCHQRLRRSVRFADCCFPPLPLVETQAALPDDDGWRKCSSLGVRDCDACGTDRGKISFGYCWGQEVAQEDVTILAAVLCSSCRKQALEGEPYKSLAYDCEVHMVVRSRHSIPALLRELGISHLYTPKITRARV